MNLGNTVNTSYSIDDVMVLLKDISGSMNALDTDERERMIQSGVHYSEMLPVEYKPTEDYISIYNKCLEELAHKTALDIAVLSHRLKEKHPDGLVLISLARAGTPIGILVRRYMNFAFGMDVPHYTISIIRGKGIDVNAMNYIRQLHKNDTGVAHFQFLDGWTGKGAITRQLSQAIAEMKKDWAGWDELSDDLAVLSDPANICNICGTHNDFLIPSACLNGTVSGLISRTVLRNDLIDIDNGDFHGAVYFKELESEDRSMEFIDRIVAEFKNLTTNEIKAELDNSYNKPELTGMDVVKDIASEYSIDDINLIKPGIGETTRVLLRRVPWAVIINPENNGDSDLDHIKRLCVEKGINIIYRKIGNYKTCGIIKNVSADA